MHNSQVLIFESIQNMIAKQMKKLGMTVHEPQKIVRDVKTRQVLSKPQDKVYWFVFNKRFMQDKSFITYPYGY